MIYNWVDGLKYVLMKIFSLSLRKSTNVVKNAFIYKLVYLKKGQNVCIETRWKKYFVQQWGAYSSSAIKWNFRNWSSQYSREVHKQLLNKGHSLWHSWKSTPPPENNIFKKNNCCWFSVLIFPAILKFCKWPLDEKTFINFLSKFMKNIILLLEI